MFKKLIEVPNDWNRPVWNKFRHVFTFFGSDSARSTLNTYLFTVVISRIFCLVNFFEFVFKLFYYCSSQSAGLFFFLSVIWVWQQQRGFFNWSRFLHNSAKKIMQPQKSPRTTFKSRLLYDSRLVCKSGKHSIWFKINFFANLCWKVIRV